MGGSRISSQEERAGLEEQSGCSRLGERAEEAGKGSDGRKDTDVGGMGRAGRGRGQQPLVSRASWLGHPAVGFPVVSCDDAQHRARGAGGPLAAAPGQSGGLGRGLRESARRLPLEGRLCVPQGMRTSSKAPGLGPEPPRGSRAPSVLRRGGLGGQAFTEAVSAKPSEDSERAVRAAQDVGPACLGCPLAADLRGLHSVRVTSRALARPPHPGRQARPAGTARHSEALPLVSKCPRAPPPSLCPPTARPQRDTHRHLPLHVASPGRLTVPQSYLSLAGLSGNGPALHPAALVRARGSFLTILGPPHPTHQPALSISEQDDSKGSATH